MADEYGQSAREAVEAVVREHAAYVRGLAARLAPDPEQAHDIAQEAFVVAFVKLASKALDPSHDLRPWLGTVVRNLSRRAWQTAIRERRLKRDGLAAFVEKLGSGASSLFGEDHRRALRTCVDGLPDRARTLLNLRYNVGLKAKRIADEISSTATAVRMALVRIREQLRQCVERNLGSTEA